MHKIQIKNENNNIQKIALDFSENRSDLKVFSKLYELIKPKLMIYLNKYVQDPDIKKDIISSTFASVWNKRDSYNPYYNFSTWVYTIAKNEALMTFRYSKRMKNVDNWDYDVHFKDSHVVIPNYNLNISNDLLIDKLHEIALIEIDKLPLKYKEPVKMRDVYRKREKEIAEELNLNLNTTKVRIHNGRKMLRKIIIEKYPSIVSLYEERLEPCNF